MRLDKYPITLQMIKYGLVGLFNTTVGMGLIFSCLYFLKLDPYLSNAIGYSVAVIISFLMNQKWTFQSHGNSLKKFLKFFIVVLLSYGFQIIMLYFLLEQKINVYMAQILAMMVYTLLGFSGHKFITFRSL